MLTLVLPRKVKRSRADVILEVAEHRLNDTQAQAVDHPPAPGIDLAFHFGGAGL